MGIKTKKILLPALLLCLVLLLSGCRARVQNGAENLLPDAADGRTNSAAIAREAEGTETEESDEPGGETRENPEAARKEYDENAPAEIVPGAEHPLHAPGEGNGASASNEEAGTRVNQVSETAEETATQTVAAENAEQMGVSEDAEAADSAMTYFTVLLQDKMGSLFECQRQNVYWETARDHVTIHKTSPEHALILNAGCYDVSARLLPENLRVDDGWVARKNPGVIVKIVDGSVLGGGVGSDRAARALAQSLRGREGWAAIDAVKSGRILLLSQELLEAPYLQTAAMVMIAKTANPALLADVDLDDALRMLMEEATGTLPTGVYFYCSEDPAK